MNTLYKAELLYKADNIEISFDPQTRIMYCKWIGLQKKEVIVKSGAIILSVLKEKKIIKVLNDNTEVNGPWHDAAEWTAKTWFPSMIEAGLKYFAWIISKDIFAEISARRAMPDTEIVKPCYSYDEAHKWLLSRED